jgi:hypothetical protein
MNIAALTLEELEHLNTSLERQRLEKAQHEERDRRARVCAEVNSLEKARATRLPLLDKECASTADTVANLQRELARAQQKADAARSTRLAFLQGNESAVRGPREQLRQMNAPLVAEAKERLDALERSVLSSDTRPVFRGFTKNQLRRIPQIRRASEQLSTLEHSTQSPDAISAEVTRIMDSVDRDLAAADAAELREREAAEEAARRERRGSLDLTGVWQ